MAGVPFGGALPLLRCPMARSLWQAMAEVWPLPGLDDLKTADSGWLLHMLDGKEETCRAMILMTLWRIWHCRNEVVHLKPAPTIESSRRFLCSYLQSILQIKQFPNADPIKGKMVIIWEKQGKGEEECCCVILKVSLWCQLIVT